MLYDKLMNPKGALTAVMLSMLLTGSLSVEAARKKTVQKIKVACVGNSITYGTGIEDREHFSYPVQLQKMLGDKYLVGKFGKPGATLLNHGHRPYMKQEEYKQAMAFKGDIAVIHLGINDTDPRNWPNYRDEFVKDYLSLIDSLRSANPKVRLILACMTPIAHRHPRFISGTKQWHDEIQEAIKVVARVSGAELIDFHAPLYPYPNLLPDAIHPNPEGAGILAKTVYGGITGNYGGLQMSSLYTDHMVLQRNQSLDIHGIANTGDQVTVSIAGQKASAIANNRGEWSVVLQPLPVGTDYTLMQEAERAISKSANSENVKAALGALNIAKGNYAQAEKDFGKQNTNTAALAQILNKNYDAASKTLDKVENPNAMTDYLHAIVAARRGNKFAANSYLKEALQKDPSLNQYAEQDLELSLLK